MVCLTAQLCAAQTQQTLVSTSTTNAIDFDKVLLQFNKHVSITIVTNSNDKLDIDERQAGEYHDVYTLSYKVENSTLVINDVQLPHSSLPQDKLSAHKISDSQFIISLPEQKHISLKAASANLVIDGHYKSIDLDILDGSVEIGNITGTAMITTVNAPIKIKTLPFYNYNLSGDNHLPQIMNHANQVKYLLTARSNHGDIIVN